MKKVFKIFLLCFFTNCFFLSPALASGSVTLNPSSGTITSEGTAVNIVINTGGATIEGAEMTVKYSGDVELVSVVSGNINGCTVDSVDMGAEGERFLYCLIPPGTDGYSGDSGIFATLNLRALKDGVATVTILSVDGFEATIGSPGNYTTTLGSGMGSGEPASVITTLPQTSAIGISAVVGGFCLLITAVWISTSRKSKTETIVMSEKLGS